VCRTHLNDFIRCQMDATHVSDTLRRVRMCLVGRERSEGTAKRRKIEDTSDAAFEGVFH